MKLLFCFEQNHFDAHIQSGRPFQVRRALVQDGHTLVDAPNLFPPRLDLYRARELAWRMVGKIERGDRGARRLTRVARRLETLYRETGCQAVVSPSTLPVAYMSADIGTYLVLDAFFDFSRVRYDSFANLTRRYARDGAATDTLALAKAYGVVAPTALLAEAIRATGLVREERIRVRPWGPNLVPNPGEDIAALAGARVKNRRLLFIGREWRRKGLDVVLDALRTPQGQDLCCSVIGLSAYEVPLHLRRGLGERVDFLGELSLSRPAMRRRAEDAFRRSSLLMLPTKAENFGIAFIEALSFGLPVVAFDTDGLSESLGGCEAAVLLPRTASPSTFAEAAQAMLADPQTYRRLSRKALDEAARFSWTSVVEALDELMGVQPGHGADRSS